MIKIAIVEDDSETQKKIKEVVINNLFSKELEFQIKTFVSFNNDLRDFISDNSQKKIYILDIELKNSLSGIEIASFIRNCDWESEIIFLTNHDKMFEKVYRSIYKVFAFIEKYHNFEKRLESHLNKIVENGYDNKMLKIDGKKISLQIYYKDILYITRDTIERKLIIYTVNNKFFISTSMEDVKVKLDSRFKIAHRACIVNTNMVVEYNWQKKYFILNNGEKVFLLSKKYRKELLNNDNS